MLSAAFIVLGLAVLLGAGLALHHLVGKGGKPPPLMVAVAHGLVALAGIVGLAFALRGPPRGAATGTASFGTTALALLVVAALLGGTIFVMHLRRRRLSEALLGIHAAIAISGFLILAAYVLA